MLNLINSFITEYTLVSQEVIILDSFFHVFYVVNRVNDGILPTYGTYYRIGLIYGITKKFKI